MVVEKLNKCNGMDNVFMQPLFFDDNAHNFIAYPFIKDKTLQSMLCDSQVSSIRKIQIIHEFINLLDCLFENGIVNRDFKADNFFVTSDDRLVSIDYTFAISPLKSQLLKDLDLESEGNLKILKNLGTSSQVYPLHWDDAHGILMLLESLERSSGICLAGHLTGIRGRIGRLPYIKLIQTKLY